MSITLSFHDVERDTYDALDVLELHGPRYVWKTLYVGDNKLVFFPGEWRNDPMEELQQLEEARRQSVDIDDAAAAEGPPW